MGTFRMRQNIFIFALVMGSLTQVNAECSTNYSIDPSKGYKKQVIVVQEIVAELQKTEKRLLNLNKEQATATNNSIQNGSNIQLHQMIYTTNNLRRLELKQRYDQKLQMLDSLKSKMNNYKCGVTAFTRG